MPNLSLVEVDLLRMQTSMLRTSYRLALSSSQRSLIRGWCSTKAVLKSPGFDNMTRPSLPLGTCTISVKQDVGRMLGRMHQSVLHDVYFVLLKYWSCEYLKFVRQKLRNLTGACK